MPAISQLNGGILKPIPSDTDLLPVQEAGGTTVPISVISLQNKVLAGVGSISAFAPWTIKTANYTAVAGDRLQVNCTSGNVTITLPAIPSASAADIWIEKIDTSSNIVIINTGTSRLKGVTATNGVLRGLGTTDVFNYVNPAVGWIPQRNSTAFASATTDPLYANVILYMPLDIANDIRDLKNKSTVALNAPASTAINNPFGQNSGVFQINGGTNSRIITGQNNDFSFGNGAFTIEVWIYPVAFPNANWGIFDSRNFAGAQPYILAGNATGQVGFYQAQPGNYEYTSNNLTLNAWNYICVSRNATTGTHRTWINGVLGVTGATRQTNLSALGNIVIGGVVDNFAGAGDAMVGYLYNLRVTNAERIGSTVPTAPFPTS